MTKISMISRGVTEGPVSDSFAAWLRRHRNEVDAVVFDVDGVLTRGGRAAPGSGELIDWLRGERLPFALLTNDGGNSPEQKLELLRQSGLEFALEEIVSASHGLLDLVPERGLAGRLFFVMGTVGTPCYAERAGLRVTTAPGAIGECTGVIIGEERYDWERVITAVFNFLLRRPQAPVIVPNPDDVFPVGQDALEIAAGSIARLLQMLCRTRGIVIEPIYLGKPYAPIFRYSHARFEQRVGHPIRHERVVMVGDSLTGDIAGGRDFGYRTVLVMTGITSPEMLAASPIQPERVFAAIGEA
jgi:HAD superfamily hydrolase (TIGR01450 family)